MNEIRNGKQRTLGNETNNLLLEFFNGVEVTLIIRAHQWGVGLALLSDPAFQFRVVLLQASHPLQVAGQSVIQELHRLLLITVERPFLTPCTVPHQARTVTTASEVAG